MAAVFQALLLHAALGRAHAVVPRDCTLWLRLRCRTRWRLRCGLLLAFCLGTVLCNAGVALGVHARDLLQALDEATVGITLAGHGQCCD